MPYDPTIYRGTAAYYVHGRPPYSHALVPTLVREAELNGSGRLLDVGCGPGILSIALAEHFKEVIGLDPDASVLANYFSMSFAAPHLFGNQLEQFETDVRATLATYSPSGLFWDWPGDTLVLLARKPL